MRRLVFLWDWLTAKLCYHECFYKHCHPQCLKRKLRLPRWKQNVRCSSCRNICREFWQLKFCVNLAGLRDTQRTGETIFLDVSLRVCPEDTGIWISRWTKNVWPHKCMWTSPNTLRAWVEQKGRREGNSISQFGLRHPPSALKHQHSWFLAFGFILGLSPWPSPLPPIFKPLDSVQIVPQAFLVLQLTDGSSWYF